MNNFTNLELRQLLTLEAIAATRSFAGAADRLNFSQSSVSQHVAALEALTGQRLVERARGRRMVELTEAGRLLLSHAGAIIARLRAAEADFRSFAAGEAGQLRVGVYQSVATQILPRVMGRLRDRLPGVEVNLFEELQYEDLLARVEDGSLDLSFSVLPLPDGPFAMVELMRDPFVLVFSAEQRPPARRPGFRSLDGLDMVGPRMCATVDLAERQLRATGAEPRVVFRSDDNGAIQGMVAAGLGFAFQPLLAVERADPRVAIALPREPVPPRNIVMVWHRDRYRSRAAEAFTELAREACAEIEGEQNRFLEQLTGEPALAR